MYKFVKLLVCIGRAWCLPSDESVVDGISQLGNKATNTTVVVDIADGVESLTAGLNEGV